MRGAGILAGVLAVVWLVVALAGGPERSREPTASPETTRREEPERTPAEGRTPVAPEPPFPTTREVARATTEVLALGAPSADAEPVLRVRKGERMRPGETRDGYRRVTVNGYGDIETWLPEAAVEIQVEDLSPAEIANRRIEWRRKQELKENCKVFVDLRPPRELLRERTIWKRSTPNGKGRPVTRVPSGSRLRVLSMGPEDYEVRTPSGEEGWINRMHVARELMVDIRSLRPCP